MVLSVVWKLIKMGCFWPKQSKPPKDNTQPPHGLYKGIDGSKDTRSQHRDGRPDETPRTAAEKASKHFTGSTYGGTGTSLVSSPLGPQVHPDNQTIPPKKTRENNGPESSTRDDNSRVQNSESDVQRKKGNSQTEQWTTFWEEDERRRSNDTTVKPTSLPAENKNHRTFGQSTEAAILSSPPLHQIGNMRYLPGGKGHGGGELDERFLATSVSPATMQPSSSILHTDPSWNDKNESERCHSAANANSTGRSQTSVEVINSQGRRRSSSKRSSQGVSSNVTATPTDQTSMDVDPQEKLVHTLDLEQIASSSPKKKFKREEKNQEERFDKIIKDLREKLSGMYHQKCQDVRPDLFWLDRRMLKEDGKIEKKLCTLTELLPKPGKWKMLVYGKPYFGKTKLCHALASIWATDRKDDFQILICHKLRNPRESSVEDQIIGEMNAVRDGAVSVEEFRMAWNSHMTKTLLVLDGYDHLDMKDKTLVREFITSNGYFGRACVLMTIEPGNEGKHGRQFNIHVDICGLTEETLPKLTGLTKGDLNDVMTRCKVQELYGVSPFFARAIADVVNRRPGSLYELLDGLVNELVTGTGLDEKTIHNLGLFLLERLKERKFVFEEDPAVLSNEATSKLKMFVRVPNGTKRLAVSHTSLMVYFAVRSLRNDWARLTTESQKETFLRNQFCYGDCSVDQVMDQGKHYCVGLLPEIVYDIKSGSFEMIQDVDCSVVQLAFRTESLLFRVAPKRLAAYGIEEVEDDPLFEVSFEALLNMLDFEYLTVNRKSYECGDVRFMKFCVEDDEQENSVVLSCVAANNPLDEGKIQEISLDFQDFALVHVHSFLNQLFKKMHRKSWPAAVEPTTRGLELTRCITSSALNCNRQLYTKVSLQKCHKTSISNSPLIATVEIISTGNGGAVWLSHCQNQPFIRESWNSKQNADLQTASEEIFKQIRTCISNEETVTVSIYMKTKFYEST